MMHVSMPTFANQYFTQLKTVPQTKVLDKLTIFRPHDAARVNSEAQVIIFNGKPSSSCQHISL